MMTYLKWEASVLSDRFVIFYFILIISSLNSLQMKTLITRMNLRTRIRDDHYGEIPSSVEILRIGQIGVL